ncbi:hypothetical protein KPH14_001396 [Odynerus spinipes]|uniref:Uncharacterized protein n=1 Tax=Odynerus spinipes TaxID=1348599 RepID=A0AAD9REH1_9HYME|nr:hypothetical protein KPH14_001396 [Odynerus spinipes]
MVLGQWLYISLVQAFGKPRMSTTAAPRLGKLNLASSASADICARGTLRIVVQQENSKKNITINDALHVPDLRTNFTKDRARVIDENGNDRLIADHKDGLYYTRQKDFIYDCMIVNEDTEGRRKPNVCTRDAALTTGLSQSGESSGSET